MRPLIFLSLLLLAPQAFAQDARAEAAQQFETGLSLLAERDTAGAIAAFEGASANGIRSTAVEFNLGTLALESGDLAMARLHLERAARLDPGNPSISKNLGLTLAAAGWPETSTFWTRATSMVPPLTWVIFSTLISLIAAFALVHVGVEARRVQAQVASALVFCLMASAVIWQRTGQDAISLASIEVRAGPTLSSDVVASLQVAERVRVEDFEGNWAAISGSNGDGWVPRSSIVSL